MRGKKLEPRGLEPHIYVLSRAESGFISFYTEDDLEEDEGDVQENGMQACLIIRTLTVSLEAQSLRTIHQFKIELLLQKIFFYGYFVVVLSSDGHCLVVRQYFWWFGDRLEEI